MEQSLDLTIGKIASLVQNQVSLLCGVQDELEDIKIELQYMKSFIQDADRRKEDLHEVDKTWVKYVRDSGHEVVDTVDKFTYHANKQRSWNRLYKSFHIPKTLMEKHALAVALQNVKRRLREHMEINKRYILERGVIDRREGVSFRAEVNSIMRSISIGESALHHRDDDLVGIEDTKQELLDVLLNEERDRSIISVVGMGGSGKTTLVASVFRSHDVKIHFDRCYVWVTVSQTNYTLENLLRSLVKEFYRLGKKEIVQDLNQMGRKELVETLVNYLHNRRYLVVLDDIWEIDNLWISMKVALPENGFGSRVILTTRKEDIASFPFEVKSHTFSIKLLSESKAWELFRKKAFPHGHEHCSPEIEEIAKSLVKKCGGLPLGLATLGALMSTKKQEFEEWKRVCDCLNWELSNNPRLTVLKSILWLSFYELPYRLKQCFLYCCIFPEDYVINGGRLKRLWIAEGFVEQDNVMTQEDTAQHYVMELVHRCMLQIFNPTDSFRVTQAFKMHDLFRELAVSVSGDEKFCNICSGTQDVERERRLHRLSIQSNYKGAFKDMSKVRSLFVFDVNMVSSLVPKWLSDLKLIKVLALKDAPIVQLPKKLMRCYNLRYLSLMGTLVETLPGDIGNLRDLQTLDIRHTRINVLPEGITKLSNLRHLITYRYNYDNDGFKTLHGTQAPTGICELKSLQFLETIEVGKDTIRQVSFLTQLRRIDLRNVKEADGKDLCILIERMCRIDYLSLQTSTPEEVLNIDSVSSASPTLRKLDLAGKLKRVPSWFATLHGLKHLSLKWSRLSVDFFPQIGNFANLIDLRLTNAYEGKCLHFQNGFEKLKYLWLNNFPQLNEMVIERGVMPRLHQMKIGLCFELRRVPRGIEHLSYLHELNLRSVKNDLIENLRKEGGQDRQLVQHIPIIIHQFKLADSTWAQESLT